MIDGWREDFDEGPYDYLAVRDGWQIFQNRCGDKFRVSSPERAVSHHETEALAKEHAYANGCSKPKKGSK